MGVADEPSSSRGSTPPPRAQLADDGAASPPRDFAAKPTKDVEVAEGTAPGPGEEEAVDGVFGERAGEGTVDYRRCARVSPPPPRFRSQS